jgi:hypothetical protein
MKILRSTFARLVLVGALSAAAACEPNISPPPVPPPITYLFKQIFWSAPVDTKATPPRQAPHSCAILAEPADATLYAPYSTVDTFWYANGWAFWTACVIPARDSGRALPVVKITGYPNEQTLTVLDFHLNTAPVFGRGSGHYSSFAATSIGTFNKLYIEATG